MEREPFEPKAIIKLTLTEKSIFVQDEQSIQNLKRLRITPNLINTNSIFPTLNLATLSYPSLCILFHQTINCKVTLVCNWNGSNCSDFTYLWKKIHLWNLELKVQVFSHIYFNYAFYSREATKFGGDFLLYPDEPTLCHSQFIVEVKEYRSWLPMEELVGKGRLATHVNKKWVLATQAITTNDSNPIIKYFTLEWAHFN